MKRAIILFPGFNNMDIIQGLREKYDPLAHYIPPHITIVFPFESDISTEELTVHFDKVLKGIKKFNVQLNGFTGDYREGYLFLNVKKGNDNIIELHDRLYCEILKPFLFNKVTYCPHLTVGRLQQQVDFDKALDELSYYSNIFETVIDKIYIESIDSSERSTIEFSYDLD